MKEVQQLVQVFKNATIDEQVEIRDDIYNLKKYIDKYFDDNLYCCGKCYKHFLLGTAMAKYETWTENVCTNPFGGYLDNYKYELITRSDFRYYCPICGERLDNHYQSKCYSKGKQCM